MSKLAYGLWDPLWWSQNHLKVDGVGESADVQGTTLPCSLLPKLVEAYRKFAKIKPIEDLKVEVIMYDYNKFQPLNQSTQITNILGVFAKI